MGAPDPLAVLLGATEAVGGRGEATEGAPAFAGALIASPLALHKATNVESQE